MKRLIPSLLLALTIAVPLAAPLPTYAQQDSAGQTVTLQNAATATGNGSTITTERWNALRVKVIISATATVTFEVQTDGTNWDTTSNAYNVTAPTTAVSSATATGSFVVVTGGAPFRARISSYSSGTVTVKATQFYSTTAKAVSGGSVTVGGSSGDLQYNNAGSLDGSLLKQGSNKIEQRNGTNAQSLSVFNAYVDDTNYNKILANAFSNGGALLFTGQGANRIDSSVFFIGNSNPGGATYLQAGGTNAFGLDPTTGNFTALGNSFLVDAGVKRVSTQFDKTSNTTLANITGLSAPVFAGRTFNFYVTLYTTSNVAGGVKFAISGTATATAIIYEATVTEAGILKVPGTTRATAMDTTVGDITAVTAAKVVIEGTITVNASGTLTVQFAQNTSNGSPSSVLVGSPLKVIEIP